MAHEPLGLPDRYTSTIEDFVEIGVSMLKRGRELAGSRAGLPFGVVQSKRADVQRLNLAQVTPAQEIEMLMGRPQDFKRYWQLRRRERDGNL